MSGQENDTTKAQLGCSQTGAVGSQVRMLHLRDPGQPVDGGPWSTSPNARKLEPTL